MNACGVKLLAGDARLPERQVRTSVALADAIFFALNQHEHPGLPHERTEQYE